MKSNKLLTFIRNYAISILVAMLIISTAITGSVFAKYVSQRSTSVSVSVKEYGNVNIELCEGMNNFNRLWKNSEHNLAAAPGTTIDFNPYVVVKAGSKPCWIFAKVEKSGGDFTHNGKTYTFDQLVNYSLMDGNGTDTFKKGDGTAIPSNVLYCKVETHETSLQHYRIVATNNVTIPADIPESVFTYMRQDATRIPSLTITAYAVEAAVISNYPEAGQEFELTAKGAWDYIQSLEQQQQP